jgi:transcriptional/translational regulatory protein YebC/TACO1
MERTELRLAAPWDEVREHLKEHNVELTDEDLQYEPGQEEALLERLGNKFNKSREEVKSLIESLSSNTDMAG